MPGGDGPDARVETLYRRMFHILYAYALRGMSDPSLAEEAVQDTFRVPASGRTSCSPATTRRAG